MATAIFVSRLVCSFTARAFTFKIQEEKTSMNFPRILKSTGRVSTLLSYSMFMQQSLIALTQLMERKKTNWWNLQKIKNKNVLMKIKFSDLLGMLQIHLRKKLCRNCKHNTIYIQYLYTISTWIQLTKLRWSKLSKYINRLRFVVNCNIYNGTNATEYDWVDK